MARASKISEIALLRPSALKGQGVSLGRYATRADAGKVLAALLPAAKAVAENAAAAIIRMPGKGGGYNAVLDQLEADEAGRVCAAVEPQKVPCAALTPDALAAMAGRPARTQGSDDSGPAAAKTAVKPRPPAGARKP
jgi:hypothetical protein